MSAAGVSIAALFFSLFGEVLSAAIRPLVSFFFMSLTRSSERSSQASAPRSCWKHVPAQHVISHGGRSVVLDAELPARRRKIVI